MHTLPPHPPLDHFLRIQKVMPIFDDDLEVREVGAGEGEDEGVSLAG